MNRMNLTKELIETSRKILAKVADRHLILERKLVAIKPYVTDLTKFSKDFEEFLQSWSSEINNGQGIAWANPAFFTIKKGEWYDYVYDGSKEPSEGFFEVPEKVEIKLSAQVPLKVLSSHMANNPNVIPSKRHDLGVWLEALIATGPSSKIIIQILREDVIYALEDQMRDITANKKNGIDRYVEENADTKQSISLTDVKAKIKPVSHDAKITIVGQNIKVEYKGTWDVEIEKAKIEVSY